MNQKIGAFCVTIAPLIYKFSLVMAFIGKMEPSLQVIESCHSRLNGMLIL